MQPSSGRYDLFAADFFRDPHPLLRRMRDEAPVHWHEDIGAWFVTGYADAVRVLEQFEDFTSERAHVLVRALLPPDVSADFLEHTAEMMSLSTFFTDPPGHTRMRAVTNRLFTGPAIHRMAPRIAAVVDDALDGLAVSSAFDAFSELCEPIPCIVIADVLGIPLEDRHLFRKWVAEIVKLFGGVRLTEEQARLSQAFSSELNHYLVDLIAERRRKPKDDLVSLLLAQEVAGRLPSEFLAGMCTEILAAGHNTSTDLLGIGIVTLLSRPAELSKLRADPSLWQRAVEELLRFDPPAPFTTRLAKRDVEIRGRRIRRGELVYVGLAAANRDPAVYDRPDTFDVERRPAAHLAFGTGPHFCLGAPLARLEARLALSGLFERVRGLRLSGEVRWREGDFLFRGPRRIPLSR